jgi:hypothetical protein
MRLGDKIVVILVLVSLVGVAFFYFNNNASGTRYVEIWQDGELYGVYELNEDVEEILIEHNGMTNLIVIENETVFMKEANCPTQQCILQGKISKDKQSIVCLPHKIVVKVVDENESEVDFIVR